MIKIHVKYHNEWINEITLKGHALYADYGKDIVCAAVSSTYLCTLNAISLFEEETITLKTSQDKKIITITQKTKTTQTLLQNMINCLKDLERQYPQNIKISKEEEE